MSAVDGSGSSRVRENPFSSELNTPVSHPSGLEASPRRDAFGPLPAAMGPATLGADRLGHDLGGGRLATREVRDRTGLLRARLGDPQTARHDHSGISEGPQSAAPASPPSLGRW